MELPPFIQSHVPLAPLSSYKTGGPAQFFSEPQHIHDVMEALAWSRSNNTEVFLLGKGTNLIFSDQGFPGLVIHLGKKFQWQKWEGNQVGVASGVLLYTLVREAIQRNLAGIECLGGIPGSVGGATWMNAGAYGQEIGDSIVEVTSCTPEGHLITRSAKECQFTYRSSIFCHNQEIILESVLKLNPGHKPELQKKMSETLQKRKQTQPLQFPNAGSVFKRPAQGHPGELIERSGCKGLRVGGAEVSELHANFIINRGGATSTDIWKLSEIVVERVQKHTGVTLEREVRWIGPLPS